MNNSRERWQIRAGAALEKWRADLSHAPRAGDLAALGRLAVPEDAMLLACFAALCNQALGPDERSGRLLEVLARCAFLAARLSCFEQGASLAAAMAKQRVPRRPLVSPVRAAAIFSLENVDQACMAIASLLGQLGGRAGARLDPLETVQAMSNWIEKRRWIAFDYHRANYRANAPPEALTSLDAFDP